jgi:hypothetical protein
MDTKQACPPLPTGEHASTGDRWMNWGLALLTVPATVAVVVFAIGGTMSLDACSDRPCRTYGPSEFWFGVLLYGAPVAAVLTIAASFVTAQRKRGIVAPLCGLALLIADLAILVVSFRQ